MTSANISRSAKICRILGQLGAIVTAAIGGCWLWVYEYLWFGVGTPTWDWSQVAPILGPTAAFTCFFFALAVQPDAGMGWRALRSGTSLRIGSLIAAEAGLCLMGVFVTSFGPTITRHELTSAAVIRGIQLDRGSIVSETTSGTRVELPHGVHFAGGTVAPFVIPTENPDGPGVMNDFVVDLPENTKIYGVACLGGPGRSANITRSSSMMDVQCVSQGQTIDGFACDRGATVNFSIQPRGIACRVHWHFVQK